MADLTSVANDRLARSTLDAPEITFDDARERFLRALGPRHRTAVQRILHHPNLGGGGLRMWLRMLTDQQAPFPTSIPSALAQVYLDDPEALPLHDCADCGLAVPVRPNRYGLDGEPDHLYFQACPSCGGVTGRHAYWSRPRRPR